MGRLCLMTSWDVVNATDINEIVICRTESQLDDAGPLPGCGVQLKRPPAVAPGDRRYPCSVRVAVRAEDCVTCIGAVDILCNARYMEVFSDSDEYLCTSEGIHISDRSVEHLYLLQYTFEPPVRCCHLQFVRLDVAGEMWLRSLHVTLTDPVLTPCAIGSTLSTAKLDLTKVKARLAAADLPIPDAAEQLMKSVANFQQSQLGVGGVAPTMAAMMAMLAGSLRRPTTHDVGGRDAKPSSGVIVDGDDGSSSTLPAKATGPSGPAGPGRSDGQGQAGGQGQASDDNHVATATDAASDADAVIKPEPPTTNDNGASVEKSNVVQVNDAGVMTLNNVRATGANNSGVTSVNNASVVTTNSAGVTAMNNVAISGANGAGITAMSNVRITGANNAAITSTNHVHITGANNAGIIATSNVGVAGADSAGIAASNNVGIAGANNASTIATSNNVGIAGADNAGILDATKNAGITAASNVGIDATNNRDATNTKPDGNIVQDAAAPSPDDSKPKILIMNSTNINTNMDVADTNASRQNTGLSTGDSRGRIGGAAAAAVSTTDPSNAADALRELQRHLVACVRESEARVRTALDERLAAMERRLEAKIDAIRISTNQLSGDARASQCDPSDTVVDAIVLD